MSLYWLRPEWTQACCANCGAQIWPEGDPDWGLCWPCMSEQTEAQQQEQEARKPVTPRINIRCDTNDHGLLGTTYLDVVKVEQEDDGSWTAVTDHWPARTVATPEPSEDDVLKVAQVIRQQIPDAEPIAIEAAARAALKAMEKA